MHRTLFHSACSTLHRAPVGQGPSGPEWLATALGFWSGRALATGTAWAGLCLICHHSPPRTRSSGRRPGGREKRACAGGGRQIWTGRREKNAHPSTAIIKRCRYARFLLPKCHFRLRHSSPRAGAASDLAPSPTAVNAVTSPHRHPRASLPRCEVLDLRGSGPGRAVVVFDQQNPRTPPTSQHPLAHASTARQDSRSSRRISVAVHAMAHAPLPLPSVLLVPPHTRSASLFHAEPRTPFLLPAVVLQHARCLTFLLQGPHPFLGRPFFLSTCIALRRAPRPPACTHVC